MVGVLALLGLMAGLGNGPDAGDCPSAVEVEARLRELLPPATRDLPRQIALRRVDGRLHVELWQPGGARLVSRDLDAGAPCGELAAAAAVVLAAAWSPGGPAPALPEIDLRVRRPPPPPRPGPSWEVGAGAWLSVVNSPTGTAGATLAAGGSVEAALAPPGWRLGGRLAFLGTGTRQEPLGPGQVSWTRLATALGPRYALRKGHHFLISLHAEALLAAVLVQGQGFPTTYQSAALDVGLGGGVRIGYRVGPLWPWIGGILTGWLRPQEVRVDGLDASVTLPRLEVLLGAGVAIGRYP